MAVEKLPEIATFCCSEIVSSSKVLIAKNYAGVCNIPRGHDHVPACSKQPQGKIQYARDSVCVAL